MKEDFLKELEYIGLTARVKRLSDKLMYSAIEHYKRIDVGIEPNWHIIFLILKEKERLTVTDISAQLQLSHPAVVKIVKRMKEQDFLESTPDSIDSRKQYISLTKKAKAGLPEFEKEWNKIKQVIKELADNEFLAGLNRFEDRLNEKSFAERYNDNFEAREKIEIRNAKPEEFEQLGKLMVNVYSQLEGFPKETEQPKYYQMLANIGELTQKPCTEIIVAVTENGEVAGGVVYFSDMKYYGSGGMATLEKNASGFRLLAVDPIHRGKGIGRLLSEECIRRAREINQPQVIIHITMAMQTAWKMYEKIGFVRSTDLDFMQEELPVFGFRLKLLRT